MGIDIEKKFMEGMVQRERELAQQRAAAQDQRAAESETASIPEHPRIAPEDRIQRAIGKMFSGAGRGGLDE